jgi:hypothetical protein
MRRPVVADIAPAVAVSRDTLDRVLTVLEYVSAGRRHAAAATQPYPDATARRALAEITDLIAAHTGHTHTADCLCVMVPMDVDGARECHHCGVHGQYGQPCPERCDVARMEAIARG